MIAEIASIVAAVSSIVAGAKSIPEYADRRRKKKIGQRLVQIQMQLIAIIEEGMNLLDAIESNLTTQKNGNFNLLSELLIAQEKRLRTLMVLILDPDSISIIDTLDPTVRRHIQRDITEKRIRLLSDLDVYHHSSERDQYIRRRLHQIYDSRELKQSRQRLERLHDESRQLSEIIRSNFDIKDLI